METQSIYVIDSFDKKEYFYYDDPANGDLHEVVPGKVCVCVCVYVCVCVCHTLVVA